MDFNSNPLSDLVKALDAQNTNLGKARNFYLQLEATRKHDEALLIKQAEGKSHAEKLTNAQAKIEWAAIQKMVARAEAIYEFERLKFSVMEKNWQSEYLCLKLDGAVIQKQS